MFFLCKRKVCKLGDLLTLQRRAPRQEAAHVLVVHFPEVDGAVDGPGVEVAEQQHRLRFEAAPGLSHTEPRVISRPAGSSGEQ